MFASWKITVTGTLNVSVLILHINSIFPYNRKQNRKQTWTKQSKRFLLFFWTPLMSEIYLPATLWSPCKTESGEKNMNWLYKLYSIFKDIKQFRISRLFMPSTSEAITITFTQSISWKCDLWIGTLVWVLESLKPKFEINSQTCQKKILLLWNSFWSNYLALNNENNSSNFCNGPTEPKQKKCLVVVWKTVAERLRCFCWNEIQSAVKALLCLLDALCIHKILTIQAWQQMKLAEKQTHIKQKNHHSAPDLNNPWKTGTDLRQGFPLTPEMKNILKKEEKNKKKRKNGLTRWREPNATLQSTFIRCQRCAVLNNDTIDRGNHETASMAAIRGKHAGENRQSPPVDLPLLVN